jgi:hypothetical protein
MPTTIVHTIKSSGGDYSSLSAWEAAQQRNLVTADEIAVAECYGFVDTTATTISGWTTGINNYIIIRAHPSARATMPMATDGSRYLLQTNVSSVNTLDISQQYTQVHDIQVESTGTGPNSNGMRVASNCLLRNCISRIAVSNNAANVYFFQGVGNIRIQNCVGISIVGNGNTLGGVFTHDNAAVQYDNCTTILAGTNRTGWRVNSSTVNGIVFRNCLSVNLSGTTGNCFTYSLSGVGTSSVDAVKSVNNLSSDSTAFGTNPRLNQTVRFVDSASGNYRLSTLDTAALNFGVNLSTSDTGSFSDTFDGLSRGAVWSIGAAQPNVSTQTIYNAAYGPKIATGQLVMYLDAGNRKSYSGTGTEWLDLSGNNNSGSLASGSSFSSQQLGVMTFDGIDDTVVLPPSNQITGDNLQTLTVSVWIKYSKTGISRVIQLLGTGNFLLFAITLNEDSTNSVGTIGLLTRNVSDTNVSWLVHQDNYHLKNRYINVTGVINGSSREIYVDGVLKNSDTNGMFSVSNNTVNARIGSITQPYEGSVGLATIYRRALSAKEVLQNFNAVRSRFGI